MIGRAHVFWPSEAKLSARKNDTLCLVLPDAGVWIFNLRIRFKRSLGRGPVTSCRSLDRCCRGYEQNKNGFDADCFHADDSQAKGKKASGVLGGSVPGLA